MLKRKIIKICSGFKLIFIKAKSLMFLKLEKSSHNIISQYFLRQTSRQPQMSQLS